MQLSLDDLIFRRPVADDAQQTLDLMIRCDIDEYGELDSDMEDLQYDWSQIDLNRDAWLALTPQGSLVGYAAVLPRGTDLRYMLYSDPTWAGDDLGRALLARCEARSAAVAGERQGGSKGVSRIFIADTNRQNQDLIMQAGFQAGKRIFQMQIDLGPALPEPTWPEDISVRTAAPGQDDRAIYELIQAAFAQPKRTPQPFEDWKNTLMWPDTFEPELWFLATTGDTLVGASLCLAYETLGWVRQLGVLDSWRRKDIGAALLRHTFVAFKKRGFDKVGLAVESKRPDAYLFYQKVGMRQVRQYHEYVKPLNEG